MDVRTQIRDYFAKTIGVHVKDDDDIFVQGIANSLFALQLVVFVENEFLITLEREDLDIKHFCSIAALTNFVIRKLGKADEYDPKYGPATK